ncbi:MAG TPA: CBS domain-containing protein [Burkholderiales bacterium]|nr:CBS domain-containing protein [Burkholderiales bacterium]
MPVSEICNREVIIMQPGQTVFDAACLMRQQHVGDVLVVEEREGTRVPVGIVTDRDLVIEIMAPNLDPKVITVGDIMVPELATVKENTGLFETIEYMRVKGVRRLPVVDENNELVGIITLDDLLELLAEELATLAKLIQHERKKEVLSRR